MRFRRYLLRRSLSLVPTAFGVTVVTFVLLRLIPGDPVLVILGEHATGTQYEQLRHSLGLDAPLYVQYVTYVARLLQGSWGTSTFGGTEVLPLALRRFGATLEIAVPSLILSFVVGLVLGTWAALRRGQLADKAIRLATLSGFSVPTFWLGLMLILVFAVTLRVLPSGGLGGPSHLILPVITLSAYSVGIVSRVTRAAVLDILNEDFVTTARATGIGWRRVIVGHVLKNALIPVVTIASLQFGATLSGAVVTETVFNYPGLGSLIVEGISARDYPTVQGAVLLGALAFLALNFLTDVAYMWLDPRVARGGGAR